MLLVDGNALVHRAYWATAQGKQTFYGNENITGTKTFISMFEKALKFFNDNEVIVAFDHPEGLEGIGRTWRHAYYPEYKEKRKEAPYILKEQFEYVKEYLKAFNIPFIEMRGVEGDDIIGTICEMYKNKEKNILTGDKDFLQLVDENTTVYLMRKGITDMESYSIHNFLQKTELLPNQIPDFKALAGDSSDNIRGVKGIGEKAALNLLINYGNIENIYKNINNFAGAKQRNLIAYKDLCPLYKKIATILRNVELNVNVQELLNEKYDISGRKKFLEKFNL